jgi:hypothetical protein
VYTHTQATSAMQKARPMHHPLLFSLLPLITTQATQHLESLCLFYFLYFYYKYAFLSHTHIYTHTHTQQASPFSFLSTTVSLFPPSSSIDLHRVPLDITQAKGPSPQTLPICIIHNFTLALTHHTYTHHPHKYSKPRLAFLPLFFSFNNRSLPSSFKAKKRPSHRTQHHSHTHLVLFRSTYWPSSHQPGCFCHGWHHPCVGAAAAVALITTTTTTALPPFSCCPCFCSWLPCVAAVPPKAARTTVATTAAGQRTV